jgi:CubicO group peptidase (beta-lactamase class C family)
MLKCPVSIKNPCFWQVLGFFLATWMGWGCNPQPQGPPALAYDTLYHQVPPRTLLTNQLSDWAGFANLDTAVEQFRRQWRLQGVSVAITRHGNLLYAKGFGWADRDRREPVGPHHGFRVASVSKLITALAIMQLAEQGKLRLTDRVLGPQGILRDSVYRHPADARAHDIEVQHLLRHTGGWAGGYGTDPLFLPVEVARKMNTPPPAGWPTVARYMLAKALATPPGQVFDYSNFGYCLLGEVVAQVSGQPYETYVQRHLLGPLGIYQTRLGRSLPTQKWPLEVSYYDLPGAKPRPAADGSGRLVDRPNGGMHLEPLGPAGGWVATPTELLRLVLAADRLPSHPDLLQPTTIDQMTVSFSPDSVPNQEIGWRFCHEREWLRTGSFGGTHALVARRADGLCWALLTNTSAWPGPEFSRHIWEMLTPQLDTLTAWPPGRNLFETDTVRVPKIAPGG